MTSLPIVLLLLVIFVSKVECSVGCEEFTILKSNDYVVCWNITNGTEIEISFEVLTQGWIGFGLSDPNTGGMLGSDIVTIETDDNGTAIAVDRFTNGSYSSPVSDCNQDWELLSFTSNNGYISCSLKRLIDSSDSQDRSFSLLKSNRIIMSYSADDSPFFSYHENNRLMGELSLNSISDGSSSDLEFDKKVVLSFESHNVTSDDLTFCKHFDLSDFLELNYSRWVSTIQISMSPVTTVSLYRCTQSPNASLSNVSFSCTDEYPFDEECVELEYIWNGGDRYFNFPNESGIPFGSNNNSSSTRILVKQTHVPPETFGFYSGSEVSLYFSKKSKMKKNASIFQVGNPTGLSGNTIFTNDTIQSSCVSQCTSLFVSNISVFALMFVGSAEHNTGSQIFIEKISLDGNVTSVKIDYFIPLINQYVFVDWTISPGDDLHVRCNGNENSSCGAYLYTTAGYSNPSLCNTHDDGVIECLGSNGTRLTSDGYSLDKPIVMIDNLELTFGNDRSCLGKRIYDFVLYDLLVALLYPAFMIQLFVVASIVRCIKTKCKKTTFNDPEQLHEMNKISF